jgi:hypothetical protein
VQGRAGAASDGSDKGTAVAADRQADGIQAHRRILENLASIERHKLIAKLLAGVRFADGIEVIPTQQTHTARSAASLRFTIAPTRRVQAYIFRILLPLW